MLYSFYAKRHLVDKFAQAVRLSRQSMRKRVSLAETKKPRRESSLRGFFVSLLLVISRVQQAIGLLVQVHCQLETVQESCPDVPGFSNRWMRHRMFLQPS